MVKITNNLGVTARVVLVKLEDLGEIPSGSSFDVPEGTAEVRLEPVTP